MRVTGIDPRLPGRDSLPRCYHRWTQGLLPRRRRPRGAEPRAVAWFPDVVTYVPRFDPAGRGSIPCGRIGSVRLWFLGCPRLDANTPFDNLTKIVDGFTEAVGLKRYAIYVFDYGAPIGFRLALTDPERVTAAQGLIRALKLLRFC